MDIFRFKNFSVSQENCAMRVCTDSCVLGAYANADGKKSILDIGTGTGLLSLMMAQRFPECEIDAVEIEEGAAMTAEKNFAESPFFERIRLHLGDVREYDFGKKFDFIICNPPFYETDFISENEIANTAMHKSGLRAQDLAKAAARLLNDDGEICVMYPPDRIGNFIKLMAFWQFSPREKLFLHNLKKGKSALFRVIVTFSRKKIPLCEKKMEIWQSENVYSDDFTALLKNFYLKF
jgi:tRNA1Val (adenine37-N6)-methyltransferase